MYTYVEYFLCVQGFTIMSFLFISHLGTDTNCMFTLSGSRRTVKSATVQPDQEELESSWFLHTINQQVQEQWEPENHALDEGKFVRGKKEGTSSLDPKTGNQWLVFGGGTRDRCAGVVDAFTGKLT